MSICSVCHGTGDINRDEEEAAASSRMGLRRVLSPKAEKDNLISERDTTSFHVALFGQAAASFTCTLLNSLALNKLGATLLQLERRGGRELRIRPSTPSTKRLGTQGKVSRRRKRRAARARRGKATSTARRPSGTSTPALIPARASLPEHPCPVPVSSPSTSKQNASRAAQTPCRTQGTGDTQNLTPQNYAHLQTPLCKIQRNPDRRSYAGN